MTSKDRSAPARTNDSRSDASSHKRASTKDAPGDAPKDKSAPRRPVTTEDTARANDASEHKPALVEAGDPPNKPGSPRAKMTPEEITGTSNSELFLHLVAQVWNARAPVVKRKKDNKDISRGAILAALKGIGPQNEMEGMLAVQMVTTHNAAMECLRQATVPGLPPDIRDQNLKHAAKLMSIYVQQMEALDKRRGKGQQKITVEHVNVHAGGQAIVGNVEAPAPAASIPSPPVAPLALPDRSDEAMPLLEERAKEKVPRKQGSR